MPDSSLNRASSRYWWVLVLDTRNPNVIDRAKEILENVRCWDIMITLEVINDAEITVIRYSSVTLIRLINEPVEVSSHILYHGDSADYNPEALPAIIPIPEPVAEPAPEEEAMHPRQIIIMNLICDSVGEPDVERNYEMQEILENRLGSCGARNFFSFIDNQRLFILFDVPANVNLDNIFIHPFFGYTDYLSYIGDYQQYLQNNQRETISNERLSDGILAAMENMADRVANREEVVQTYPLSVDQAFKVEGSDFLINPNNMNINNIIYNVTKLYLMSNELSLKAKIKTFTEMGYRLRVVSTDLINLANCCSGVSAVDRTAIHILDKDDIPEELLNCLLPEGFTGTKISKNGKFLDVRSKSYRLENAKAYIDSINDYFANTAAYDPDFFASDGSPVMTGNGPVTLCLPEGTYDADIYLSKVTGKFDGLYKLIINCDYTETSTLLKIPDKYFKLPKILEANDVDGILQASIEVAKAQYKSVTTRSIAGVDFNLIPVEKILSGEIAKIDVEKEVKRYRDLTKKRTVIEWKA